MIRKSIFGLAIIAALVSTSITFAAPEVPITAAKQVSDEQILTLTVDGTEHNFSFEDLEAMPHTIIRTSTPWYDTVTEFEGVSMDYLLKKVGAHGDKVLVMAINDYGSEIPMEDISNHGVVLAYLHEGKKMEIEDKGPLFVIYPFDDDKALQTQMYYSRAVWQVDRINVK